MPVDTLPAYALSADRLVVLLISGITFGLWPDDAPDGGMANEMGRVVMQVTTCRPRRGHSRAHRDADPLRIGGPEGATSLS